MTDFEKMKAMLSKADIKYVFGVDLNGCKHIEIQDGAIGERLLISTLLFSPKGCLQRIVAG